MTLFKYQLDDLKWWSWFIWKLSAWCAVSALNGSDGLQTSCLTSRSSSSFPNTVSHSHVCFGFCFAVGNSNPAESHQTNTMSLLNGTHTDPDRSWAWSPAVMSLWVFTDMFWCVDASFLWTLTYTRLHRPESVLLFNISFCLQYWPRVCSCLAAILSC